MQDNNQIYALCYCEQFEFAELQTFLLENVRCTAYRSVLHVEWRTGYVLVFDYGVVVFWKLNVTDRHAFMEKVKGYGVNPLQYVIEDEFTFSLGNIQIENISIKDDNLLLPDEETLTLLAVSHGIAQSTKLGRFEYQVQQSINDTAYIPQNIAMTGRTKLSRKQLAKLRGRLFITSSDIMLKYDLLDVPDFFWEYPELDAYYKVVSEYLEIKQRVEVLSKKLETIHELFDMIADEQKHKHSSLLEWIIIWLIAFEIVVFLVHDILKIV